MKRRLLTYLPIAVLAVGLALGMLAALMALRSGHTGPVEASVQQTVDNSPQIYLGSANDPGGGDTSTIVSIDQLPVTSAGFTYDLRLESVHLTEPLVVRFGNQNFDDVSNGNFTSALGQRNQTPGSVNNTIATAGRWSASLQLSSCSQCNIDGLAALPVQYSDDRMARLAGHGNSTKTRHLRHGGALEGVGNQLPQLAFMCSVCKGDTSAFSAMDGRVSLLRTKGGFPDSTLSGTRTY